MLTNVVRNIGAVVIDGTCLTGVLPTGGQQDDTAMGDYDEYEDNTYTAPAPAPAPLAPSQPSRHRERESTREREREREEPRRSEKHRRR